MIKLIINQITEDDFEIDFTINGVNLRWNALSSDVGIIAQSIMYVIPDNDWNDFKKRIKDLNILH